VIARQLAEKQQLESDTELLNQIMELSSQLSTAHEVRIYIVSHVIIRFTASTSELQALAGLQTLNACTWYTVFPLGAWIRDPVLTSLKRFWKFTCELVKLWLQLLWTGKTFWTLALIISMELAVYKIETNLDNGGNYDHYISPHSLFANTNKRHSCVQY